MWCTEIVQTTHQKHAVFERGQCACQSVVAACQTRQTLPEGRIEPFDESGVDVPGATLRCQNNSLHLLWVTLIRLPSNGQFPSDATFEHAHNAHLRPRDQAEASLLSQAQGRPKRALNDTQVRLQPINRPNHGATHRDPNDLFNQHGQQCLIPHGANRFAQSQAGRNHDRLGHSDDPRLCFYLDFIGLNLPQFQVALPHYMVMHALAVLPCALLPIRDCALVQFKRGHNRLHRTLVFQQGHHTDEILMRFLDPIQGRVARFTEGSIARHTPISPLFQTMHANVALSNFASGAARRIRAKSCFRVDWLTPLSQVECAA